MQIVCIWVQLIPLHPKTPSSLASFKSKLVLPFWYQLTQVVLEKRPLNGCSSSSSSSSGQLDSTEVAMGARHIASQLSERYVLLRSFGWLCAGVRVVQRPDGRALGDLLVAVRRVENYAT